MALRCFIAVEIPESVRGSIGRVIEKLRKSGADVKWLPPENIHITLKFLGSTEESLLEGLRGALSKKLSPYSPFYITIAGVGCFPDERRPRVVWVGTGESGQVRDIQKEIETEMLRFGFPSEEREFSPHLTIGRVKGRHRIDELKKMLEEYRQVSFGELEVRGVTLMKSELNPAGAKYFPLAQIPFGGRTDVKQG